MKKDNHYTAMYFFLDRINFIGALFFQPKVAVELFGIEYNAGSAFLGYIIGWFCLLVTILIGYIIYLLKLDRVGYKTLIYIVGFWWMGLGIGVYIVFGKTENLLLDSSKGLLFVILNYLYAKEKQRV